MMDPSTENRPAAWPNARSRSLRLVAAFSCMAALAPALSGCQERSQVSVGELPCVDDERVRCKPLRDRLDPVLVQIGPDSETAAEIVWDHALDWAPAPPCVTPACAAAATDFLVHDDGEVTLAGVFGDETGTELWVSWLDAEGQALFATMLPEESEWLRGGLVTQLTLSRDADGSALLLVVRAGSNGGTLRALALARSGQVETRFAVDAGEAWPHTSALLDSDVIIAPTNQELARYRRGGELLWRQTQLAWLPNQEFAVMFDEDTWVGLLALAVDGRDRIWAALSEGTFGIAQLDPDGVVAWHGLLPALSVEIDDAAYSTPIAVDSRDRAIVGFGPAIVRFDADGSDEQRRAPLGSSGLQENYYPQSVDGLDVDAQDRMYVATQDGPRSQRRLLIERVSEDFRQRDRFVIPFAPIDTIGHVLRGLQLAENGDVYVRLVPDGSVPEQTDTRIVRVRLPSVTDRDSDAASL